MRVALAMFVFQSGSLPSYLSSITPGPQVCISYISFISFTSPTSSTPTSSTSHTQHHIHHLHHQHNIYRWSTSTYLLQNSYNCHLRRSSYTGIHTQELSHRFTQELLHRSCSTGSTGVNFQAIYLYQSELQNSCFSSCSKFLPLGSMGSQASPIETWLSGEIVCVGCARVWRNAKCCCA